MMLSRPHYGRYRHHRSAYGTTAAAAAASFLGFALGGFVPLLTGVIAPGGILIAAVSLAFLSVLGALAARAGGAPMLRGAARVLILGALVMGVTTAVGSLIGGAV